MPEELTGRALDAEVARRVFGCDVQEPYPGGDPICMCKPPEGVYESVHGGHRLHPCHDREGLGCDDFELAYYSTDIVAAMEVLCKIREDYTFLLAGDTVNGVAHYYANVPILGISGRGTTLAEAICRMALSKLE